MDNDENTNADATVPTADETPTTPANGEGEVPATEGTTETATEGTTTEGTGETPAPTEGATE